MVTEDEFLNWDDYYQDIDFDYRQDAKECGEDIIFIRETDGLDWLSDLTKNELWLLMFLTGEGSLKGKIDISTTIKQDIYDKLKFSYQTLLLTVKSLRNKDFLKRTAKDVYLISPFAFYKCNPRDVHKLIKEFNNYKSK